MFFSHQFFNSLRTGLKELGFSMRRDGYNGSGMARKAERSCVPQQVTNPEGPGPVFVKPMESTR